MPSSKTQHLTIELRHLRTGYTERRRSVVISLDLSLSIRPGEIVMLMGPNGSGKSTLMHTMAGLLPPLAGEVELGEKPLSSLTMKEVARQLSLVLTERIPAGNMDVWEVVTIGRYPYTGFRGVLSAEDKRICEEALATCRLTELRERIFDTLNQAYSVLYGVSELSREQIDYYVRMYIPMLRYDFVTVIVREEDDKVIGFGITLPNLSRALQKAKGSLFPFGWAHLLRALKMKNPIVDLYLIGVIPEYQNKGVNALLFDDLIPVFQKNGVRYAESNPELETNAAVQMQWNYFERKHHKTRRAWIKEI